MSGGGTVQKRRLLAVLVALAAYAAGAGRATAQAQPEVRWFKGNTHSHTLNSDGDSAPEDVARWYREQGYHFLVITDHNFVTPVDGLNSLIAAADRFLVIAGEEISDRAAGKPIHVNALGVTTLVQPQGGERPAEALRRDVEAARGAGAVAQINHPNFGWALNAADMLQGEAAQLLEVFNGHPQVNNLGGGDTPAAEALWDQLLSSGRQVFGVATDDLHDLKRPGNRFVAGPGRGWVMVRAPRLTAADVLGALARGDFYATTGIDLKDLQVNDRVLTVSIRPRGDTRYRTRFVGKGGRVLKEVVGPEASYTFAGDEGYVRATITDSNGLAAWVQPVREAEARKAP
jgi:hypothetical protein